MNKRITDNIKFVMLFFVFGIHILLNFRVNSNESFPIMYNLIELFLRPCINILFIITGYGLLSKYYEKDYKYYLNKFLFFTMESIIFLFILKTMNLLFNHFEISVANYFSAWFLFTYTLVPFILMILKLFEVDLDKIKYVFISFLPISVLLTFNSTSHTGFLPFPLVAFEYFPFIFLGYFVLPKILKKNNMYFMLFSFIYILVSFYLYKEYFSTLSSQNYFYNYFYQYFSPHVILLTLFEFILLYKLFEKLKFIKIKVQTLELYLVSGYSIGFIDYFLFNNSIYSKFYQFTFWIWGLSFIMGVIISYFLSIIYTWFHNKYIIGYIRKYIEI
jgi:surface polysaccharide O-acyltransferase-like enzyme